jgi:hypothetical protein
MARPYTISIGTHGMNALPEAGKTAQMREDLSLVRRIAVQRARLTGWRLLP